MDVKRNQALLADFGSSVYMPPTTQPTQPTHTDLLRDGSCGGGGGGGIEPHTNPPPGYAGLRIDAGFESVALTGSTGYMAPELMTVR